MYRDSRFNKHLKIEICYEGTEENNFEFMRKLNPGECTYIENQVSHVDLTKESFDSAVCFIIAYMRAMNWTEFDLDISKFNRSFAPPVRMTKEEIEKNLGYKVEIVDKK